MPLNQAASASEADPRPLPDGWTDATELVDLASADLQLGEVMSRTSLSLYDAMSALQLGHPCTDSGYKAAPPLTGNRVRATLQQLFQLRQPQVLWLMDTLFSQEMMWHRGFPLIQTVLTSTHLRSLASILPGDYDGRFSLYDQVKQIAGLEESGDPVTNMMVRAVVVFIVATAKCCDITIKELNKQYVMDEDMDWNTFSVPLFGNVTVDTLAGEVDQVLAELEQYISQQQQQQQQQSSAKSKKGGKSSNTSAQKTLQAIHARIQLRKQWLLLIAGLIVQPDMLDSVSRAPFSPSELQTVGTYILSLIENDILKEKHGKVSDSELVVADSFDKTILGQFDVQTPYRLIPETTAADTYKHLASIIRDLHDVVQLRNFDTHGQEASLLFPFAKYFVRRGWMSDGIEWMTKNSESTPATSSVIEHPSTPSPLVCSVAVSLIVEAVTPKQEPDTSTIGSIRSLISSIGDVGSNNNSSSGNNNNNSNSNNVESQLNHFEIQLASVAINSVYPLDLLSRAVSPSSAASNLSKDEQQVVSRIQYFLVSTCGKTFSDWMKIHFLTLSRQRRMFIKFLGDWEFTQVEAEHLDDIISNIFTSNSGKQQSPLEQQPQQNHHEAMYSSVIYFYKLDILLSVLLNGIQLGLHGERELLLVYWYAEHIAKQRYDLASYLMNNLELHLVPPSRSNPLSPSELAVLQRNQRLMWTCAAEWAAVASSMHLVSAFTLVHPRRFLPLSLDNALPNIMPQATAASLATLAAAAAAAASSSQSGSKSGKGKGGKKGKSKHNSSTPPTVKASTSSEISSKEDTDSNAADEAVLNALDRFDMLFRLRFKFLFPLGSPRRAVSSDFTSFLSSLDKQTPVQCLTDAQEAISAAISNIKAHSQTMIKSVTDESAIQTITTLGKWWTHDYKALAATCFENAETITALLKQPGNIQTMQPVLTFRHHPQHPVFSMTKSSTTSSSRK